MSDNNYIDQLRRGYPPELPYGFAERVARSIMVGGQKSLWDYLVIAGPRTGLAFGAICALLLALGLSGSGPGIVESVDQYASLSSLLELP